MSRGARWTIIAFILLFTWMFLSNWSGDTPRQRGVEGAVVAFMLTLALGLAAPKRFLWALRLVAGAVAVGYFAYFVSEVVKLVHNEAQPLSLNQPNATAAGLGFLFYGIPALVFALGAERVGLARLFGRRHEDESLEEDLPDDDEHLDEA